MYIRRQRHVSHRIDQYGNAAVRRSIHPEADATTAEELPLEDLGHQHAGGMIEAHQRARFEFLAGMHQRGPFFMLAFRAKLLQQETLDRAAARDAVSNQSSWEHTCVVRYQQIAGI